MIKKYKEYLNDNFWKWFGKSKVVDEQGNPKVMYHGTGADFNEFNLFDKIGIWVASNPKTTSNFGYLNKGKPSILPLYIKAENIFDYKNDDHINMLIDKLANFRYENKSDSDDRTLNDFIEIVTTSKDDFKTGDWRELEFSNSKELYTQMGFDGVWLVENNNETLLIFEPTQIKSAIGNNGDFNINSPKINENTKQK